jgi:ParB-like chromosome segregation protein Spo0J
VSIRFHPSLEHLLEPMDRVSEYPGNPRRGDVQAIVESLRANGMFQPVVAQRSTGYILAGNHRHAALVSLGEPRIPVLWVDVGDVEAKRIALADNRTADLASYDDAALLELLRSLGEDDAALLGTGYGADDLDDLALLLSRGDEVADLDELAAALGEPGEQDGWVTVVLKLPAELAGRWRQHAAGHGDDVAAMTALLGTATS